MVWPSLLFKAFGEKLFKRRSLSAQLQEALAQSPKTLRLSTVKGPVSLEGEEVDLVGKLYVSIDSGITEYLRGRNKEEGAVRLVSDGVVKAAVKLAAWGIDTKTHPDAERAQPAVGKFIEKFLKAARVRKASLSFKEQKEVINLGHFSAVEVVDTYLKAIIFGDKMLKAEIGTERETEWRMNAQLWMDEESVIVEEVKKIEAQKCIGENTNFQTRGSLSSFASIL